MNRKSVVFITVLLLAGICNSLGFAGDKGAIVSGETHSGQQITGAGQRDSWTITGNAGDRLLITAVTTSGALNTVITLYPPGGGAAEASTAPWGDHLDHQIQLTGEYTVVVYDYQEDDIGYYDISLLTLSGVMTSAADLDGGEIVSGETLEGRMNHFSDMDGFQFEATAGDRILVTAVTNTGSLNTVISLYPPNGEEEEASSAPWGDFLDHQIKQTGRYTLVIADYQYNDQGYYNLSLMKLPGALTSADDEDGGSILSGQTLQGRINLHSDLDGFQFDAKAGDRVLITAVTSAGSLNTVILLYPPNSEEREASTSPWGDHLDHQIKQTGRYTIVLQDYQFDHEGYYNLSLMKLPGTLTSTADGDGGPITSGETLSGRINTYSDMDGFQFDGEAGDRILVSAVKTSGSLNTWISLYPPNSDQQETSTSPWGDFLDHQLKQSGKYTLIIQDYQFDHSGYYNVTLLKDPGGVTSAGDQDGGPLTTCRAVRGNIHSSDLDGFEFTGKEGDRIVLTANTTSGSLRTFLALYPPSGGPAEADTGFLDNYLDHRLMESGEYRVVVRDYNLGGEGYYTLMLQSSDIKFDCSSTFYWNIYLPAILYGQKR